MPSGASPPGIALAGAAAGSPSSVLNDLERVAGGFAHDFNNLILVMMGATELALGSLEEDSPAREHLDSVQAAARQGRRLCRQLLSLARRSTSEPRELDLRTLVAEALELLRHVAGKQVEVVTHIDEGAGLAIVDPGEFEQLLFNLVLNARDALGGSGRIDIQLRSLVTSSPRDVMTAPTAMPPGSWLVLTVLDAGCGMSAETLDRIFRPFFTTKAVGQGVGLGLTLCREIVARCGGFFDVESEPGRGTRVSVYLPRVDEPGGPLPRAARSEGLAAGHALIAEAPAGAVPSEAVPSDSTTVLLVEDEPLVRAALREGLDRLGIGVLEAGSGEEALDMAERFRTRIDAVVSDLALPDIHGRELVERLRAAKPGLRWLFITGSDASPEDLRLADGTSGGLLQKPFSATALHDEIRRVLAPEGSPGRGLGEPTG